MCRVMSSQFRVTANCSGECGNQQQAVVFRELLLTRCQKEFESANNVSTELRKNLEEAKTAVSLLLVAKIDHHMTYIVLVKWSVNTVHTVVSVRNTWLKSEQTRYQCSPDLDDNPHGTMPQSLNLQIGSRVK